MKQRKLFENLRKSIEYKGHKKPSKGVIALSSSGRSFDTKTRGH
jgi:hypothetical protein